MTVDGDAPAGADDAERLARIEDAGSNASAPREQRWIDGWLVRLSPGKAKPARCIQPLAAGRRGIDEKLALCLPLCAAARLQPYVRITPFASRPDWTSTSLRSVWRASTTAASWCWRRSRHSRKKRAKAPRTAKARRGSRPPSRCLLPSGSASRGGRRASAPPTQSVSRKLQFPTTPSLARDRHGVAVAGGQAAIDGPLAGLYDIFTIDGARGRGHAERICRHLLGHARRLGATAGYLQVDAGNDRALSICRRLGFRGACSYHYRTPLTAAAA